MVLPQQQPAQIGCSEGRIGCRQQAGFSVCRESAMIYSPHLLIRPSREYGAAFGIPYRIIHRLKALKISEATFSAKVARKRTEAESKNDKSAVTGDCSARGTDNLARDQFHKADCRIFAPLKPKPTQTFSAACGDNPARNLECLHKIGSWMKELLKGDVLPKKEETKPKPIKVAAA